MSENVPSQEEYMEEVKKEMSQEAQQTGSNAVALVGIIATAFIVFTCIVACAVVVYAFVNNAPW